MHQELKPIRIVESLPGDDLLRKIQQLYDEGLILQAYRLGEQAGPVTRWRGDAARVLGGRIAMNLGAPRLAQMLHIRAFREHPDSAQAACFYVRVILELRGPLAAISFHRKIGQLDSGDAETRAEWLAFRAVLASIYRDFETADDLLAAAYKLAPDHPWLRIERSRVLEAQDRYDEALATARESLEIQPGFRSGIHAVAHLLQLQDKDDQALELLMDASQRIESAALLHQLAALQDHLQLHGAALETLSRIDEFCPFGEKKFTQAMAWVRSNVAYHGKNYAEAIKYAELADNEFMTKVAEKLREQVERGEVHPRVQLDFPFVRQHHMTCAPATLSAISRFWNRQADHLSLVDAICYDGTPSYSQRSWANSNGWATREFAVTWESAVALIDRGLPFTLATVQVGSAHLQAVIGYDKMRGTLLCRDPYQYYVTEFAFDLLQKYNAAHGPRGMVMVPAGEAHRLEGLDLPESDLFDLIHEIEASLAVHNRDAASAACERLAKIAPGHRLLHSGRRAIATYDSDSAGTLEALDALLALYPEDQPLLLWRVHMLHNLERRDLLLPLLKKICDDKKSDPIFLQFYARELRTDFGDDAQVMNLLRKELRRRPTDPAGLSAMGNALWSQRKLEEATDLYYLVACVDETNESAAQSYFTASRHLRKTDQAIAMLQRRFARLGKRSSKPACSLFSALELLDRTSEAFAVLDKAQALRPEDGDLLLFAADAQGRRSNLEKANALLKAASGKTRRNAWLRCAARLAEFQGDMKGALKMWREVLAAEPLAEDANSEVAHLIAQTKSSDAAAIHLAEVHARFPHNTMLQQLRITWLRARGDAAVVPVARELVEQRPGNVWARVELALHLTNLGQAEEALQHATAALAISPHAANAHNAAGQALHHLNRLEEARDAYRRAIAISVDFTPAINHYVDTYPDAEGRREALEFVRQELVRQVIFGEGIIAYRQLASAVVDPNEVLNTLREAQAARPDLWQSWSAIVQQLCDMNQLDEAMKIAKQATTERFQLLPRAWLDLSLVCGLRADRAGQIEALQHCLQLSPMWSMASRRLAQALQNDGRPAEAETMLRRAIARDPLNGENYEALAKLLWKEDKQDDAIAQGRRAVMLNPWLSGMWDALKAWSEKTNRQADVVQLAREVCSRRPGEAIAWLVLARMLDGKEALQERIDACDVAIKLSPRDSEAFDLKACLLLEKGDVEAAKAACNPPEFGGKPTIDLRGRLAWIHGEQKNFDLAIDQMRAIVEENPAYYWGWRQLVHWLSNQQKPVEYLQCASAMAKAFPHDSVAQNHLAEAQLRQQDFAGAKATLQRIVGISPNNAYALEKLFSAQLKDGEFPAAQATLQLMQRHLSPEYYTSRLCMLAAARRDGAGAAQAFGHLCLHVKTDETDLLFQAVKSLDDAGMQGIVNELFERSVTARRDIPVDAVDLWSERIAKSKNWAGCRAIMDLFKSDSPQWGVAAISYLNALAPARQYALLDKLIRKNKAALRAQTRVWGSVGYALFAVGKPRQCAKWLSDYREHRDVEPWMLLNLAGALRRSGRGSSAREVHLAALKLPRDQTSDKHTVWMAFEEVSKGQQGDHLAKFAAMDISRLDKQYPFVGALVKALTPLSVTGGDAREISKTARRAIASAAAGKPGWNLQRELVYAIRRSIRRVVAHRPSVGNRLWALGWYLKTVRTNQP